MKCLWKTFKRHGFFLFFLVAALDAGGCASTSGPQDFERIAKDQYDTIEALKRENQRLNQELDKIPVVNDDLASAKNELDQKFSAQMAAGDLAVSMQARGLVVTVLDRILFDSGKIAIKDSARSTLDALAATLRGKLDRHMVYVEGHADNEPIRHSGWRSNWELSTARATEVIHYFIEADGLDPQRLAASGYGEYAPVAGNGTEEGRMKNRRVEIVITPRKVAPRAAAESE